MTKEHNDRQQNRTQNVDTEYNDDSITTQNTKNLTQRCDTEQNGTQLNVAKLSDTQHNNTLCSNSKHNGKNTTLNITFMFYPVPLVHLCRVSFY
jgi:hypothetical protein